MANEEADEQMPVTATMIFFPMEVFQRAQTDGQQQDFFMMRRLGKGIR
ncbi:MAG: hypothetical protein R3F31_05795 [Verrucomicrobiales bacterium]